MQVFNGNLHRMGRGKKQKRGRGVPECLFPPLFLPYLHVEDGERESRDMQRAAAAAEAEAATSPPCTMYDEIYVSCLGRAGLGWLGSHNDNDNDTNKLRSS